jgi:TonB-linked SusC/RagA family outer membrane protein
LFRADQAYGLFPAVSAGWNLSEEKLFHKLFPVFDLFKIRGSYGLVGSDYGYTTPAYNSIQYSTGATNVYGIGAANNGSVSGANEGSLVNPYATWEKERKTDLGLDVNMLNGKIILSADYFYNYRYDQLIAQGDVPLIMGQALPKKNNGITENKGFDGIITYKSNIGKLNFSVNANGSVAKNKIIYISEAPNYPYQAKTGTQIGLTLGYHNLGFYQQADFNANGSVKDGIAKPLWSVIQPGDLKYADLNHDGLINNADMTYLSKPNLPTTTVGLGFTLDYKGFSLRALIQGAFDYGIQINGEGSGDAFNSNLRAWNLERWTPATALTATYPRIGLNTNINNISWQTVSDFWFVNAAYARLKSLEIGYQLSDNWLKKAHVRNARIYASGYNLLTISKMNKYQQDPEVSSGQGDAYPITANFNLGIQLGF